MRDLARKLLDVLEYDELAARLRPFLVRVANGVIEQVVGEKILLYSPGELVRSYEVSPAGLESALGAAVSGDYVDLPGACEIEGEYTVPAGVGLGARGNQAVLRGTVRLSAGSVVRGLVLTGVGVIGPGSGEGRLERCLVTVESEDGPAVAVLGDAGGLVVWDCELRADGEEGSAAVESHEGKITLLFSRLFAVENGVEVNPIRVEAYEANVNETLLTWQDDWEYPKAWDSKNDGTPAGWNTVGFDDSGWGTPYLTGYGTWYGPWANDAAVLYRIYLDMTNVTSVNSVVVYTAVDDTNNIYLNGTLVRANGPGFEDNADITSSVNLGEMNVIGFEMTNSGGDLWCAWNVVVNWTESRWNAPEVYGCELGSGYTGYEVLGGDRAAYDAVGRPDLHANDVDDGGIHHTLGALDGRYAGDAHTHGTRTENVLVSQGASGGLLKDSHVKDGLSGAYLVELVGTLTGNRTLTLPDANAVLAGVNLAQVFSQAQTFEMGNGRVVIDPDTSTPIVMVRSASTGTYMQVTIYRSSAGAGGFIFRHARGTESSPSALASGDDQMLMEGYGYDGGAFRQGAAIRFLVNGTVGTDDMPTDIRFLTRAAGASGASTKMSLTGGGALGIGTTSPSSQLDVVGDAEVGSGNYVYWGDPSTNGSWRIGRSGNNLVMERRESGSWVTKSTVSA